MFQKKKYIEPIYGKNVFLRLITLGDARYLFDLRATPKSRYVHPINDYEAHCRWLEQASQRLDDYLFMVVARDTGLPQGTISIYRINFLEKSAEIGRWLMQENSRYGFEAIELAYIFAFELLAIDTISAEVITDNRPVLAFHLACGLKKLTAPTENLILRGHQYTTQRLMVTREMWPAVQVALNHFKQTMEK